MMRFVQFLCLVLSVTIAQPSQAASSLTHTGAAVAAKAKASELNPDDADAYVLRSAAEVDKGDLDGAIADGTKAIELDPNMRRPTSIGASRGGPKAIGTAPLPTAPKPSPSNRVMRMPMSCAVRREVDKGDWDGAMADGTRAIKLNPDDLNAYINRAIARKAQGDLDGAIADCTKTIALKPDAVNAYVLRSAAKVAKGDLTGAIADSTKAIALKPDNAEAYVNRGVAKSAKGDLDGAIADFTQGHRIQTG